jgi:hypothetical protein
MDETLAIVSRILRHRLQGPTSAACSPRCATPARRDRHKMAEILETAAFFEISSRLSTRCRST